MNNIINKEKSISNIVNKDKLDIEVLEKILNIKVDGIPPGMSKFQIEHFVLNKREHPTDFAQFLQTRFQLYNLLNVLVDLYYQYRTHEAKIKLCEGIIEKISQEEPYPKIRKAKIELQKLEMEKNKFKLKVIGDTIFNKMNECLIFYKIYKKYERFEHIKKENLERLEEEFWKEKSRYFTELYERYGITPNGFLEPPHCDFSKISLTEIIKQNKSIEGV